MFTDTSRSLLADLGAVSQQAKAPQGKPLAKSLHTVTVLVNVARYLEREEGKGPWTAIHHAAKILGLSDMPDTYGLIQQAYKKLSK